EAFVDLPHQLSASCPDQRLRGHDGYPPVAAELLLSRAPRGARVGAHAHGDSQEGAHRPVVKRHHPTTATPEPRGSAVVLLSHPKRRQTMSNVLREVLTANQKYAASFGDKGKLAMPPARRFAILTCMDARLDPAKFAGLAEGDAHVIRNAGGRASDDAIRSLVISYKLLGTREWFVIHHTDCGMETFN